MAKSSGPTTTVNLDLPGDPPVDGLPSDLPPDDGGELETLRAQLQVLEATRKGPEEIEQIVAERLAEALRVQEAAHAEILRRANEQSTQATRAALAAEAQLADVQARGAAENQVRAALGREPSAKGPGPKIPHGHKGSIKVRWVPANGNHTAAVMTQKAGSREQRPASGYPLRIPGAGGMGTAAVLAPGQTAVLDKEAFEFLLTRNKALKGYVDCGSLLVLGAA